MKYVKTTATDKIFALRKCMTPEQKQRKLELQRIRRNSDMEGERLKARKYYSSPKRSIALIEWRKSPEGMDYKRKYVLKNLYGISIQEYDEMFDRQKGLCALCGKPENALYREGGKVRRLNVDHCHKTKRVRGLLCRNCNVALGLLKDDVELIKRMINYLQ